MAASINIPVYSDALVVLATAGIVVPMVRRWGMSPVLGYLAAGAVLGPLGLGSFINDLPFLYWLTVVDAKNVAGIAELGVVFLLFLIGLELSFERLMAMRRLVFGLGSLQIAVTTALLSAGLMAAGLGTGIAIVIGGCLALSSTAIVLEVLSAQGRMTTTVGRTSFSVLLAQDLAVVPLLMFVSILGANSGSSVMATIGVAMLQAAAAVGFIAVVGRLLLRPLFRLVASAQSSELFIAATLFVVVATGVVAAVAGLSMALGAFVAGLMLAETEYRRAVVATIEPFKGLLLGIFFFTVGMAIDFRELAREPFLLAGGVIALIAVKAIVLVGLCRYFRISWPASLETALLLGPGGEFAFVGLGLAAGLKLIDRETASFTLAVTALTMALIPLMPMLARRLSPLVSPPKEVAPELLVQPAPQQRHAIVVGYGRVGKVVCGLLDEHSVPFVATDHDATEVAEDRRRGHNVFYGDATNPAFLEACGLSQAAAVIVTINARQTIDEIVETTRQLRPDIQIISRARDAAHARHLYGVGVTDAVPETIEASLQLSEAALVGLGIPAGPVIATIHERRDAFRAELQKAALSAGRPVGHTFRARKAEARGGDRPPDGATAATPTTPAGGAASTAARKGPGTV